MVKWIGLVLQTISKECQNGKKKFTTYQLKQSKKPIPVILWKSSRRRELKSFTSRIQLMNTCYLKSANLTAKKFISIADEGITFDDEDKDLQKRREKAYKKKFKPLTSFLKKTFGSEVTKVVVSERLESTPAMISSTKYSHSANMERIMKAQAFQHGVDNDERTKAQRVFEINPRHPFVTKLLDLIPDDDDDETVVDSVTMDAIWLLHDVALLNSGFTISNTMKFSKRMTRVLKNQLTIESLELEDEIDLPDEEDDEPDEFDMDSEGMNMDDFEFNLNDLGDDLN